MKYLKSFLAAGMVAALVLGVVPAFAQSVTATAPISARAMRVASTSAARAARAANAVVNVKSAADKQIATRVDSLNKLLARVQAMAHLTADEKSSISATVSGDISSLNALQSKIDSDATTTLKADIQSIAKGERIYLLVEPQIAILAAADRAASIGDMLTALASKIATRLASTPNATASSLLTDLQAKISDAATQSATAISETASLQPDNGVASVQASNTAALKDARSKIQVAQKDIKAAYQDAAQIVKDIKGAQPMTSTSTSPQ